MNAAYRFLAFSLAFPTKQVLNLGTAVLTTAILTEVLNTLGEFLTLLLPLIPGRLLPLVKSAPGHV
jgi:hypothetical protein